MTPTQRTIVMFAVLWLGLAAWQALHTMRLCFVSTPIAVLQWTLQFALLGVPLIVLRRDTESGRSAPNVRKALAVIVLSYLPVTLALRIAETCGQR
jgi:hypothetical protein